MVCICMLRETEWSNSKALRHEHSLLDGLDSAIDSGNLNLVHVYLAKTCHNVPELGRCRFWPSQGILTGTTTATATATAQHQHHQHHQQHHHHPLQQQQQQHQQQQQQQFYLRKEQKIWMIKYTHFHKGLQAHWMWMLLYTFVAHINKLIILFIIIYLFFILFMA